MKRILHAVEAWMDDFKIKNKFYILYILCVLVPLIVTDSAVFSVVMKSAWWRAFISCGCAHCTLNVIWPTSCSRPSSTPAICMVLLFSHL